MRWSLTCLFLAWLATNVVADEVMPLPKAMSGRYTAVVPGQQTFTNSLSVVLDVPSERGPVTGRLTVRGVTCGAVDEPLSGTWDGTELRFESLVRPNVNAQRPNGQCGNGKVTFILTRKPGQSAFEGESRRDGSPIVVEVRLAP